MGLLLYQVEGSTVYCSLGSWEPVELTTHRLFSAAFAETDLPYLVLLDQVSLAKGPVPFPSAPPISKFETAGLLDHLEVLTMMDTLGSLNDLGPSY